MCDDHTRHSNNVDAETIEEIAQQIEQHPETFEQGLCDPTLTCGCVEWQVKELYGPSERGDGYAMAVWFNISDDDADMIFGWPHDTTPEQAVRALRHLARTGELVEYPEDLGDAS